MNRQRFITIMLGASLLTVISSCSIFGSSPSAISKQYFELLGNGEIQKAKELHISSSSFDIDEHLISISKTMADKGGLKSVETKDENVHGDVAEVKFTLFTKDSQSSSGEMKFIKENSSWKIRGYVFDKGSKE